MAYRSKELYRHVNNPAQASHCTIDPKLGKPCRLHDHANPVKKGLFGIKHKQVEIVKDFNVLQETMGPPESENMVSLKDYNDYTEIRDFDIVETDNETSYVKRSKKAIDADKAAQKRWNSLTPEEQKKIIAWEQQYGDD